MIFKLAVKLYLYFLYKGAETVAVDSHGDYVLKETKADEEATGQSNKCLENEVWAKIANFYSKLYFYFFI